VRARSRREPAGVAAGGGVFGAWLGLLSGPQANGVQAAGGVHASFNHENDLASPISQTQPGFDGVKTADAHRSAQRNKEQQHTQEHAIPKWCLGTLVGT